MAGRGRARHAAPRLRAPRRLHQVCMLYYVTFRLCSIHYTLYIIYYALLYICYTRYIVYYTCARSSLAEQTTPAHVSLLDNEAAGVGLAGSCGRVRIYIYIYTYVYVYI